MRGGAPSTKSKAAKIGTAALTKSADVPPPLGWTHDLVLLRVTLERQHLQDIQRKLTRRHALRQHAASLNRSMKAPTAIEDIGGSGGQFIVRSRP